MQENRHLAQRQVAIVVAHLIERHAMPEPQCLGCTQFDRHGLSGKSLR